MSTQEQAAIDAVMCDVAELHENGRVRGCMIVLALDDGDVRMHGCVFNLKTLIALLGGARFVTDQLSSSGRDALQQKQDVERMTAAVQEQRAKDDDAMDAALMAAAAVR